MSTFLTADTHFGHALMLREEACARPYSTTDDMDQCLIDNWNRAVHPRDTVWHLGDFAMGLDERRVAQIFHALHGTKKLILGNHDVDKKGHVLPSLKRLPWADVAHAAEITHDGQRIMLSHYAGYVWNAQHRGAYQAFGHSHGKALGLPGSVDVGVDAQAFKPISVEEFIRQADATILNAEKRIEDIVRVLRAKAPKYAEREGGIKHRERLAREAEKAARRAKP
ncbi:metallophosphoesterase [Mesorhizobium sp. M1409]|uniref:metallophosphoesterase n=1 Tax=unclassified Mesorhizobium TaxID=325217 RepID=UPI00333C1B76